MRASLRFGQAVLLGAAVLSSAAASSGADRAITALGRLEPKDGVIRLAGPSRPAVVISQLMVAEGDRVEEGQTIAILDSHGLHKADVARLTAELQNAERELERVMRLFRDNVASDSARDEAETAAAVARANLQRAQAELDLSVVRSPIAGQVLQVHTRTGERVGPDGIVELGRTQEMYAIAEIYETDIGRIRVDQRATVTSPALSAPLHGTVERIGSKVGKMDVLSTDPAAKTDARVVEVEIRLDDGAAVANLTNLQVEIEVIP
jgi:HlyD family secretion protein